MVHPLPDVFPMPGSFARFSSIYQAPPSSMRFSFSSSPADTIPTLVLGADSHVGLPNNALRPETTFRASLASFFRFGLLFGSPDPLYRHDRLFRSTTIADIHTSQSVSSEVVATALESPLFCGSGAGMDRRPASARYALFRASRAGDSLYGSPAELCQIAYLIAMQRVPASTRSTALSTRRSSIDSSPAS